MLAGTTVDLMSGWFHNCTRLSTGAVYCWGGNWQGQLGDGTTTARSVPTLIALTNAVELDAGLRFTCARISDGTLRCWGETGPMLGIGSGNHLLPSAVTGITTAVELSVGEMFTCARLGDGTARCWGQNTYGQLGDGTMTNRSAPVAVMTLSGVVDLAAGADHTCARLSGGTVSCWGSNIYGQLAQGTSGGTRTAPTAITGLSVTPLEIEAGARHTCIRATGGAIHCWGDNVQGQLGDGTRTARNVPTTVWDL